MVRKKLGLDLHSEKVDGNRVYRSCGCMKSSMTDFARKDGAKVRLYSRQ